MKFRLHSLIGAMVFGLATSHALAKEQWTIQTNVPAGDDEYKLVEKWASTVKEKTNGEINIDLVPGGAIVPNNETLEAVSAGILQGHYTEPSFFTGKNAAFGVYGNMVGAWSDPRQMVDFMNNHGGSDEYNKLAEQYNVHLIRAVGVGVEAVISKRELKTLEDFKGLKIRAPEGMVSNAFSLIGAVPVNLPTTEVYSAVEKGVVDAADYTVFSTNYAQGYHKYAPYAIYPGFHSTPMKAVSINKDIWERLDANIQATLVETLDDLSEELITEFRKKDEEQAKLASDNGEVTIHAFSEDDIKKFRQVVQQEWESWKGKSPEAKTAVESIQKYLQDNDLI